MRDGGLLEQLLFSLTVEAMPGNIPVVDRDRRDRARHRRPAPRRGHPAADGVDDAGRARLRRRAGRGAAGRHRGRGGRRGRRRRGRSGGRRGGGRGAADEARRTAPATSRRCAARRGTAADLLVVGLGNPGDEYARHAPQRRGRDRRAARVASRRRRCARARSAPGSTRCASAATLVALAVPLTYMNDSGLAVAALARRYGVEPEQIVIVQDELDLPVGALKVKNGGGLAGHNGLRSIKAAPALRRLPPGAHRRGQAGVEGARRRPRAQEVLQARAGRDRRRRSRRPPTRSSASSPTASTPP